MKKFTISDFGFNTDNLPSEEKAFFEKMLSAMCDVVNKSLEGTITSEDVDAKFKGFNKELEKFDGYEQLVKDNEELAKQVKSLGESIEKMKQKGLSPETINKFDEKLNEMLESDKFKDLASGKTRTSGVFDGFSLKDVVSMTSNYTGDIMIAQQQNRVVSPVANKRMHFRDVVTVLQGDPEFPNLVYPQIYDVDRNARYITENGTLPESSFKVKEITTQTKRLGTHIPISKRMLKSRVYIRSFILNMLPEAVWNAEDWNILFGDGNGENLLGIANHTGVKPVEEIIGTAVVTGAAGSVESVETYNNGKDTLVTLKKVYDEILDGMSIQFAGATVNTDLNTAHNLVKVSDRCFLFKGVAFKGDETSADKMTFTVRDAGFKSIEEPNSRDVVRTAFAVMTYAQYAANAIVLNPMTVNAIDSEKDTMGRSLDLIKIVNGVKTIAGYPIIEYTGIVPGKYIIGDFANGANLVDYTSLQLEWAEDVNTKLANQIVLIVQEEVIFPVYNPWAFAYGDLEALKTAITKE